MGSVQLNVRTSATLLEEIDTIVEMGGYRNRTEAVNEALRLLVRRYKMMGISDRIRRIAEKDLGDRDLADVLAAVRAEDDR